MTFILCQIDIFPSPKKYVFNFSRGLFGFVGVFSQQRYFDSNRIPAYYIVCENSMVAMATCHRVNYVNTLISTLVYSLGRMPISWSSAVMNTLTITLTLILLHEW